MGRQRQGTILKKCGCGDQERCAHRWTLRYWADGRQREQSFADVVDGTGRVRYGSGRRLARDAQLKIAHDKAAHVFVDPRLGAAKFGDECAKFIGRMENTGGTQTQYRSILRAWVEPALGRRSLAAAGQARDDVIDLLSVRMGKLSISRRKLARALITGVLDEAVRAGKITSHRCGDIKLADNRQSAERKDFVFPSHEQLRVLAEGLAVPLPVWLMRGCGLRIEEALAVQKSCFRAGGTVLRVFEQATKDGRGTMPLKHRKAGEFRDIPVPGYLWAMVKDLPDGYLFQVDGRLPSYNSYHGKFMTQKAAAGIGGGFVPHSLRHAFASALLARNVPISDVAEWLGHKSINVTFAVYGHLIDSSMGRAVDALDAEYAEWKNPGKKEEEKGAEEEENAGEAAA
jgi:integrase